ncbi:unnamed protein product [Moneuplotes crassus]|uniref:Uncharacterized protein n=1 Tax=Euplotes crassus TaxID=5936 RepID=A0AAD1YB37_EUPCR|nr:unnamed protein product [Moneuplotes crassus]
MYALTNTSAQLTDIASLHQDQLSHLTQSLDSKIRTKSFSSTKTCRRKSTVSRKRLRSALRNGKKKISSSSQRNVSFFVAWSASSEGSVGFWDFVSRFLCFSDERYGRVRAVDAQRKLEENLERKVEERFKGIEQAVEELRFGEYEDSESQISQNDEDLPDLKIETYNPCQNQLSMNSQVNSLNTLNLISPKLSLFSPKTNLEVEQKNEGSQNSSPRKSKKDVNFTTKVNLPESKNLRRKSIKNSRAKRNSRVIKQDTNHGNISLLSINLPKERIEEEKTVHNRSDSIFSTASRRTVGKKRKEMIENIVNKKLNEVQLFHRLRACEETTRRLDELYKMDKVVLNHCDTTINRNFPKINNEIYDLKCEVHRFKEYDAKINRELVTKPCEYVTQKLNEYRGLVKTYLLTHKDYLAQAHKRTLKLEIEFHEFKAKWDLSEKAKQEQQNVSKLHKRLEVQKRNMKDFLKDMDSLRDRVNSVEKSNEDRKECTIEDIIRQNDFSELKARKKVPFNKITDRTQRNSNILSDVNSSMASIRDSLKLRIQDRKKKRGTLAMSLSPPPI